MNNLDEIKRSLFSASDLSDALSKLDTLGLSYRECAVCENTYHLIIEDVTFWVPRSGHRFALHICIGDVIATVDYREAFFAQQQPELSQSVPAHDSPVAAEQPILACPECGSIHFTTEQSVFVEPELNEKPYYNTCEICEFDWFSDIRVEYISKQVGAA